MAFQSSELDLTASYTVTNYTRLATRRLPPGRVTVCPVCLTQQRFPHREEARWSTSVVAFLSTSLLKQQNCIILKFNSRTFSYEEQEEMVFSFGIDFHAMTTWERMFPWPLPTADHVAAFYHSYRPIRKMAAVN